MRSTVFRGIATAIAALTAACSTTDPVAPRATPASARRSVSVPHNATISQPVDRSVWVSCANGGAGEAVHVTGNFRYDVHLTQDATGVFHLNIKSNTSGLTGVGTTSGTFYRGMMAEHVNSSAEDELNEDVRITDMIRFTAPGSGAAYALTATTHFIVDQGTYVLWDQTWDEVCR
jgi:hypothetical protein